MIKLSDSFYEDEVREGFYVPAAIKQAWGAELTVFSEIDKICRKHDIPYFIEWGSLLGAVRHGGFIPWDDDFDIGMLRKDFERFYAVALKELPSGFDVINYRTHENHVYFLSNVVGKSRICFEKEHLENFHGFPYICGIDIFILDYVYEDDNKESDRKDRAKYLLAMADYLYETKLNPAQHEGLLREAEKKCRIKIPRTLNGIDLRIYLYSQIEEIFNEAAQSGSHMLTQMVSRGLKEKNKYLLPDDYFKESIDIPFEEITVPVSGRYEWILRKKYGNYMKLVKNGGGHDYPFFDSQKRDFERNTGVKIPEYHLTADDVERALHGRDSEAIDTYKSICLDTLKVVSEAIKSCLGEGADKHMILPQVQQGIIDLGAFIEKIKGENYYIIRELEDLCEAVFRLYECGAGENADNADRCLQCTDEICSEIANRREIVFLPFKAAYWQAMAGEYEIASGDSNSDVYVVPIPYYYKNYDGTLRDMQYEPDGYPDELGVVRYDVFDFALHHPDVIVIQNPYDEHNEATSVAPFFYSTNIKKYCDELKYIPWFNVDEFSENDFRAYKNMEYYALRPGVINADTVVVQSENMRQLYINKLCEAAGDNFRGYFETKIKIFAPASYIKIGSEKTILYMVDFSCAIENEGKVYGKIVNALEILKKAAQDDELRVIWHEQPAMTVYLQKMAPKLYEKYAALRDDYIKEGWGEFDSFEAKLPKGSEYVPLYRKHLAELVDECSAYYGDPGWVAHLFRNAKKPVMIQNYEL